MKVRYRHFRCWDEPEITAFDLEGGVGKLGQVRRTHHGRGVHQHRWPDFLVAVLTRVHVEHELDQRSLQPSPLAEQERKARPRNASGMLEVHDAKRLTEVVMR